jgi:amino acid adenylation domain-containing protein
MKRMSGAVDDLSRLSKQQRALVMKRLLAKRAAASRTQAIRRLSTNGPSPLSCGQELMWVLDQLIPGNSAYNAPGVRRIKGDLNVEALQKSLTAIVARHEILRTTYASFDGSPMQVVNESREVPLPVIDLRELPQAKREDEARRLLVDEALRPFDLAKDLMLRTLLVRMADEEYQLLFSLHHIATDGWSKEVMYRDLGLLYDGFDKGVPAALPPLPIQYRDFAAWQQEWLKGEAFAKHLAFWKERLAGAPPLLELPTDFARPAVQTSRGRHRRFAIPKRVGDAVKALGLQEGATPFMILLAAFQTLLFRYTGQDDVVVGSPIAGRNHLDLEGIIGYFSNTLALRTSLSGDPSFRKLLQRVRETALQAYDHQEMPFEKLVIELKPDRDLSYTPIMQVAFILRNRGLGETLKLSGLIMDPVEIDRGTTKFDLTMSLLEVEEGLLGSCEYSTDLFEDVSIARLQANYATLLEAAVTNPDQRLSQLQLLAAAQRQQLLVDWNQTAADFPRDITVAHLFETQVERTPEAIALAYEGQALDYRTLNARANRLAHYLKRHGVSPEIRVAVCLERSPEMIVAILGILKAGGAYVPLDPANAPQRLQFMLQDADARLLLTQHRLLDLFAGAVVPRLALDADWNVVAEESDQNPRLQATPQNLAYVIFTSGSTGVPKGVMVEHGSLVNSYLAWEQAYALRTQATSHLQMANFVFDVFSGDLVRALCSGGKLVLCPMETLLTPEKLYNLMRGEKVDCAEFVPAVLRTLVQYLEETGQRLDFMRLLIAGSDSWYVGEYRSIQRLCGPNTRLINSYGVAEATIDSSYFETCQLNLSADRLVPIGRPFANTQVYILDRNLQLVPIGVPGELYLGGRGLARGYLNRPDLTAERFVADPFGGEPPGRIYRTGDHARYLADGNIEFLGRLDNQVKIRGLRIELGEIEAVLSSHPAVRETTVLAREDRSGDKRLVAYLVVNGGKPVPVEQLRRFLKEKLPDYMVPAAFLFLDHLPLTANGKVDRRALPAPDPTALHPDDERVSPRDDYELQLAMIWEEVLGVSPIGVRDNFFEVGGHSLSAVRLLTRIEKTLGQKLPLVSLFQAPTIEQLARMLQEQADGRVWPTVVPVQPHGSRLPLFFVAYPGVNPLGYAALARALGTDQPLYVLQSRKQQVSDTVYFPYNPRRKTPFTQLDHEDLATEYLAAMRTVAPNGPYLLGGMCRGAHIAFCMAGQLQRRGENVALLAVLDTESNDTLNKLWYVRRFWMRLGRLSRLGRKLWQRPAELFHRARQAWSGARHGAANGSSLAVAPARLHDVSPLDGAITLFRTPGQRAHFRRDPAKGWGRRTTAGVDIHILTGDHFSLLREPLVRTVAQELYAAIANAIGGAGTDCGAGSAAASGA